MSFTVGSLVKARGREWVVLPESNNDLIMLRPLGGTNDEVTGIYLSLETVKPAQFDLPGIKDLGDYRSCRLLRDAVRLGFRNSAGPMRSFAQIAVEPRPYQLVPLLMALKLNPVRLLIADDVGVGKTVEACLIARELIDRGEANRLAILCPPHLAEQWQEELQEKFHIHAELVLPSTATRLERNLGMGESLFERYPHVIVSMDFIKSDRHREDFIRACPELVIVDEAHTCAFGSGGRGGKHLRFELLRRLSENNDRHMIFVTATPHSGKEEAFRSLLTFLNTDFANLPEDLSGKTNEIHRRRLARYFIQRRRADIEHYMDENTPFPNREEREETYSLHGDYKKFFDKVIRFAREIVLDEETQTHRQRVRWWSALALLRALASSPAAAEATLKNRAPTADTETIAEADEVGRRVVLDTEPDEQTDSFDVSPGSDDTEDNSSGNKYRAKLLRLAREAASLRGAKDNKLKEATTLIKNLVKEGYRPIVFCRFIPTAEYVAEHLRKALKKTEVVAITGTLPPAEREARVLELSEHEKRVLICTDCLSEGVNLQEHFDAVMHYDLSWNPTRHEQREGRVDRFGQP
ncbi:MAG: DEAD/DEAH box helicase, partial [Kiritimatiellae bacterium]|nr:DEAD/DEAH box helicase [Kiritimatiellia bacterium]